MIESNSSSGIKNHHSTKKRLLVFTTTYPRWPNDTDPPFVSELCKRLTNDFDVYVLAPHSPGSKIHEIISGVDITRYRYMWEPFENLAGSTGILPTLKKNKLYYLVIPFFLICSFVALLRLVLKIKPSVIHVHWLIPLGFLAAIVKKFTQVPFVVTAHGGDVFGLRGFLFDFIRGWVVKKSSAVTAVSCSISNLLKRNNTSLPINVIPMGVDFSVFGKTRTCRDEATKNCDVIKLLYVGRLTEKKGLVYLIEAMAEVIKNKKDVCLTVVGSGEMEAELKEKVEELSLGPVVKFLGGVPNNQLPSIYAQHEIFIAPSVEAKGGDTEGFGLTIVEASMAGCLVIGSKIGGIEDIIKDGETGLLVQQKNSTDIAEKLLYAINNPIDVKQIASNGQNIAKDRFDWAKISTHYSSLLMASST